MAAFEATARVAASRQDLDPTALAVAARRNARELWHGSPAYPYCLRIGISSWEGLWCQFEGDEPEVRRLRAWAPTYRREAWRLPLAEQDVHDVALAEELGQRFGLERRARHHVFGDVVPMLIKLSESYALGLITNGASCLQREKLSVSGLGDRFAAVVVSAEFGTGKPDPAIILHALSRLGADGRGAVMIGDSLSRDVDGAIAAGLSAVWINRLGRPRPAGRRDLHEIATMNVLPDPLRRLEA